MKFPHIYGIALNEAEEEIIDAFMKIQDAIHGHCALALPPALLMAFATTCEALSESAEKKNASKDSVRLHPEEPFYPEHPDFGMMYREEAEHFVECLVEMGIRKFSDGLYNCKTKDEDFQ